MKKFIQTIKDIWTIEELRNKILLTLGFMAIYRFAAQVPLPGIDITVAQAALANQTSGGGILGLLDMFTGGAFAQASIMSSNSCSFKAGIIGEMDARTGIPASVKVLIVLSLRCGAAARGSSL